MQHHAAFHISSGWVVTVCQSTRLGVSVIQRFIMLTYLMTIKGSTLAHLTKYKYISLNSGIKFVLLTDFL